MAPYYLRLPPTTLLSAILLPDFRPVVLLLKSQAHYQTLHLPPS